MLRNLLSVPRHRRALAALGFYTVAAAVMTAPLLQHSLSTVARAVRQDVWLNVWALAWTSERLLTSPAGLFDANIFFPNLRTLAYTDHFIGEALLPLPLYAVSRDPVVTYNVAWFAAIVLTGWGGYLWGRALMEEERGDEPSAEAAALVVGAICMFVPGKRTALSHLQVISLQGVTLSLFAAHLMMKRVSVKRLLALAAAAAYAALSSWYTAVYTGLMISFVAAAGWFGGAWGDRPRRTLAAFAAALTITLAIMYPVSVPYRAVQAEMGFERPLAELVETSLAPVDFVSSWSRVHRGWMPQGSGAGGYFPGFLALVLVCIGLWDGRRRRDRWPLLYTAGAIAFAVLALGPRLVLAEDVEVPLPYEFLFRYVPGVDALRNPYRAAFFGGILLAAPAGYGARVVIERVRRRLLYRQRWNTHPRLGGLPAATWSVAALLAVVHLAEAWPGPQEIAPLPPASSEAYEWLAAEDPGGAALVVPLPRPFDDNARYQLWTTGTWVPLVNGHSGVYPSEFLELYAAGAEFPDAAFLQAVKERFPVRYIVAHYGLDPDGERVRARAAAAGLEALWEDGDDIVYRLGNGAAGGWLTRRLPTRMLGERLVFQTAPTPGCELRVVVDGARMGGAGEETGGGEERAALDIPLRHSASWSDHVTLEAFWVGSSGLPRADVAARMRPERRASITLNGARQINGPVVIAVLDGDSGRLLFAGSAAADEAGAAGLVRRALDAGGPGDELLLAVAEDLDYGLIERLRLLLGVAGGPARQATLQELGTTYAFRGRIGMPAGDALESSGDEAAELREEDLASDCRRGPIADFVMEGEVAGR